MQPRQCGNCREFDRCNPEESVCHKEGGSTPTNADDYCIDWLPQHLTEGERQLVNWQYGLLGGSFNKALWQALTVADSMNQYRLSLGFPDETIAYQRFSHRLGYWPKVQEMHRNHK